MGKIAGIFDVDGMGQFVVAEWVPDPEVIEQELFAMANAFEDWEIPLAQSVEAFRYSTEYYFDNEIDPSMIKWVPLAERTSRYKEIHGYPPNILQQSGDLKRAATSPEAWFIGDREVFFNAGALPSYGPVHQSGSLGEKAGGPIHEYLHVTRTKGGVFEEGAKTDISTSGGGPGSALPQRRFIGANDGTIAEIEEIFVAYINGLTDVFIGGEGVVRDPIPPLMGMNKLGTFPIMGMTRHGVPILRTPHGPRFGRRI